MRRTLTAQQIEKRDARRATFRALWKRVADMPELERIQITNKLGLITCDGHTFSLGNMMLIALQNPQASVLGGFRQWIKHGRAVRKGEHGCMIWVPIGGKKDASVLDAAPAPEAQNAESDHDTRFIIGTVFDITQTDEIETGHSTPVSAEFVPEVVTSE